jgi:hypothetical protein
VNVTVNAAEAPTALTSSVHASPSLHLNLN